LDGVLTFGLSGNYLFQYNLYVSYTVPPSEPFPSVSLVLNSSTNFGSQNLPTTGSYGCSIIKDVLATGVVNNVDILNDKIELISKMNPNKTRLKIKEILNNQIKMLENM
jgi:hypothetical protein